MKGSKSGAIEARDGCGRDPGGHESLYTAIALALLSVALLLALGALQRPVLRDPATWDYMSIELSRGSVPYRDIFLHKTPGAAFVGAAGVLAAPYLGLSPVQGAHLPFLFLGALAPALLYLLCRYDAPAAAALAAALFMIAIDQWAVASIEGVRPKVATVATGLACLVCAREKRFVAAGLFAALAALFWQPGICFAAGLIPALRKHAAAGHCLRSAAGAVIPVAALGVFLLATGAFGDFIDQALIFNLYYIAVKSRSPAHTLRALYQIAVEWNTVELLLLPAALFGLSHAPERFPKDLALASAAYLAMALVNFQRWPDTLLLAPAAAALLGIGLFELSAVSLKNRAAAVAAAALAAAAALTPTAAGLRLNVSYQDQARQMLSLAGSLSTEDTVVAISVPEFLIHSGKPNGWKWPYLWFGVDRFAADRHEGGFEGILAQLAELDPALILIARRWDGPLRERFEQWASSRYSRSTRKAYPHNRKGISVYRRLRNRP